VSNVNYAELSVGVSDLLRPHVYRHLAYPYPKLPTNLVEMNYLAGFCRTKPTESLGDDLSRLDRVMEESFRAAVIEEPQICAFLPHRMIVGLDWNGDEAKKGGCHFGNFIPFVEKMQKATSRVFGLRIHAGEVTVPDDSSPTKSRYIQERKNCLQDVAQLARNPAITCRIGRGRLPRCSAQ